MAFINVNNKIRLEPLDFSAAHEIFSAIEQNRNFLERWLPFIDKTNEISDIKAFINSVVNQYKSKRDEVYVIRYKQEFAGLIGFKETDWVNRKTEIGYWLIEKMQGRGIVTESVQKLTTYTFKDLKLNRIQIKVALNNTRSAAIPKRLHFQFEGIERAGERHKKKYLDLEVYSLIYSDWLNHDENQLSD